MNAYPRIAEYSQYPDAPMVRNVVLFQAPHRVCRTTVELSYRSEGYAFAGSMMRWDPERLAVTFKLDGGTTSHGKVFDVGEDGAAAMAKAMAEFRRITEGRP